MTVANAKDATISPDTHTHSIASHSVYVPDGSRWQDAQALFVVCLWQPAITVACTYWEALSERDDVEGGWEEGGVMRDVGGRDKAKSQRLARMIPHVLDLPKAAKVGVQLRAHKDKQRAVERVDGDDACVVAQDKINKQKENRGMHGGAVGAHVECIERAAKHAHGEVGDVCLPVEVAQVRASVPSMDSSEGAVPAPAGSSHGSNHELQWARREEGTHADRGGYIGELHERDLPVCRVVVDTAHAQVRDVRVTRIRGEVCVKARRGPAVAALAGLVEDEGAARTVAARGGGDDGVQRAVGQPRAGKQAAAQDGARGDEAGGTVRGEEGELGGGCVGGKLDVLEGAGVHEGKQLGDVCVGREVRYQDGAAGERGHFKYRRDRERVGQRRARGRIGASLRKIAVVPEPSSV
ncbi:hypothetical protein B0H17DRAFT_1290105 [Mycena rosella]|uniref:Uncharacterized protein n=1 Tax=Mycena rosella TaxID=1033263 RepID=A0AAD7FJM5_MYCRO|nr:hypothetical protein B0H17DRAFT_1290105 [Mycena rosella]